MRAQDAGDLSYDGVVKALEDKQGSKVCLRPTIS